MADLLSALKRDLVHAARSLSKDKVFSLVCVASLGIGMGALVALSLFGRFLNAPAPGISTDGVAEILVLPEGPLRTKAGVWALEQWSYPDYRALREAETGMAVTGWVRESTELGTKVPGDKEVRRVVALYVSANYFNTFGVTLAKGAGFDPAIDDAASAEPRVVLSDDFWRLQMSSDPDVVGKSVMLDGVLHTVVGVAPQDFRGHFHLVQAPGSMVFVPLERHPRLTAGSNVRDDRAMDWIHIHARLNPGVDIQRANALVSTIVAGLAKQYPSTNEFKAATVEPYSSMGAAGIPQSRNVLRIMLGLAASVLLVVCLNISGMMLVRGTTRERELSIRAALGAARHRLIQHLFFEALLLAVVAAAISGFVLFGIPAIAGWYLGAPVPEQFHLDAVNVLVAAGLCLIVSVAFGLLPAVRFSRPNLITAMKDDAGGGGTNTIRMHRLAAMVQIGIAVPFLVVAGVMLDRARTADFGFPLDGLAGARVPANVLKDRDAGSLRVIREHLKQASGVRSVALAEGMPIDFDYREHRVSTATGSASATAHVTHVGENFVETVGAKLLRGRSITGEDGMTAAPVAVISTALAAQLYPGAEAIGEKVTFTLDDNREQEATIVGVTNDFATSQLTTTRLQMLLPMQETTAALNAQRAPSDEDAPLETSVQLIVRGAPGDEPKLRSALETVLRGLGVEPLPGVAFPGIVTGQDMTEKSIGDLIAESMAVGVVGGLVLVLAALGIVGVIGFMVATRTKEFAIRMALGSSRLAVFRMTLIDIVRLVVPGVIGGIAIAAVLIRMMEDVLGTPLQVGPDPLGVMEPVIYAGAAAIALTASILAGLPAARRATQVAPMVAIKAE